MTDPCEKVYKPSEDTYLTIKGLETILNTKILEHKRGGILKVVEIGSGTGIITISFLRKLNKKNVYAILTDIKYDAARCTYKNLKENKLDNVCDVVQTDVISCIKPSLRVDLVVSNPPYLPVSNGEPCEPEYCGGPTGREVIDRIIREFSTRKTRVLVLTQSSLSDVEQTVRTLKTSGDVIIVGLLHMLFEDIITLACVRLVLHCNHTVNH